MTTKYTDTHNPAPATEPLALRLSEGLGPLPERRIRHVYNESKGYACDAWTEDAVREYTAEEVNKTVSVERERIAALCIARSGHFANDKAAHSFAGLVIHGRA